MKHPILKHPISLALAALSAFAATPAASATTGSAAGITLDSVSYSGTGCPAGSATISITPDGRELALLFSDYVATVGPGVDASEGEKECVIKIDVSSPTFVTFGVSNVEYRGYAQLDANVAGGRASTYHLTQQPEKPAFQDSLVGPLDADYDYTDIPATTGPLTAKCNKHHHLTIRSLVRLDGSKNPAGFGLLTSDETDASVTETWGLAWQPCK
jgi:hypothetical protein